MGSHAPCISRGRWRPAAWASLTSAQVGNGLRCSELQSGILRRVPPTASFLLHWKTNILARSTRGAALAPTSALTARACPQEAWGWQEAIHGTDIGSRLGQASACAGLASVLHRFLSVKNGGRQRTSTRGRAVSTPPWLAASVCAFLAWSLICIPLCFFGGGAGGCIASASQQLGKNQARHKDLTRHVRNADGSTPL